MQAVQVSVEVLAGLCNPLLDSPWASRVSPAQVRKCLEKGRLQSAPVPISASAYLQAGRIAYLVTNGWGDPIELDVGVPALGCHVSWLVDDGNHRLAAAIFRGDATILSNISGSVSHAAELLHIPEGRPLP